MSQEKNVRQRNQHWRRGRRGQALTEYGLILGLVVATGALVLAALGPVTGDLYQQVIDGLRGQLTDEITVRVVDEKGDPVADIYVFQFTGDGTFTGEYGTTDPEGAILFSEVSAGSAYQYLAYNLKDLSGSSYYWSPTIRFPQKTSVTIRTAAHMTVVSVYKSNEKPLKGVVVDALTANGRYYAGSSAETDKQGQAALELPEGEYKFRVYYHGQYFWSDIVRVPADGEIVINTRTEKFTVQVVDGYGNPLKHVRVYVFNGAGYYTGLGGYTNGNGSVKFDLPAGDFQFRVDYYGRSYWSETVNSGTVKEATVSAAP